MSIEAADILLKYSETTGPGDTNAGSANGSLGGFCSTTEITSATLHNLFDVVSGTENIALEAEYRCFFVHNSNATDTFLNVRVFLASEVAGGANAAVGVDATSVIAVGSEVNQAVTIADENTAPSGVSFTMPTDYAGGAIIGDLPPGEIRAVWVRRTTTNSAAQSNDGVTLRVQGESL